MAAQLVLAPGMLCDAEAWRGQLDGLADIDAVVPDYGPARSFAGMAQAVLAQAAPRFSIAGHSMGGRIALEVCRLAPERVERLCLIGTEHHAAPVEGPDSAEAKGRAALLETARTVGMGAVAEAWLPHLVHPDRLSDPSLVAAIMAMISRQTPQAMEVQIDAGAARPDSAEVLRRFAGPLLIIGGEDDVIRPPASQREMAALAPGARLVLLERCGHMAPMERPEAVTAEMRAWLEQPVPV